MTDTHSELGFDVMLAIATGLTLTAYMLGIILDPESAAAVGFGIVFAGVFIFVPAGARTPAIAIGLVSIGIAGVAVPRAVTSVVDIPAGTEFTITLVGSGLVLLLTFALVRMTAFHNQHRQYVD